MFLLSATVPEFTVGCLYPGLCSASRRKRSQDSCGDVRFHNTGKSSFYLRGTGAFKILGSSHRPRNTTNLADGSTAGA